MSIISTAPMTNDIRQNSKMLVRSMVLIGQSVNETNERQHAGANIKKCWWEVGTGHGHTGDNVLDDNHIKKHKNCCRRKNHTSKKKRATTKHYQLTGMNESLFICFLLLDHKRPSTKTQGSVSENKVIKNTDPKCSYSCTAVASYTMLGRTLVIFTILYFCFLCGIFFGCSARWPEMIGKRKKTADETHCKLQSIFIIYFVTTKAATPCRVCMVCVLLCGVFNWQMWRCVVPLAGWQAIEWHTNTFTIHNSTIHNHHNNSNALDSDMKGKHNNNIHFGKSRNVKNR